MRNTTLFSTDRKILYLVIIYHVSCRPLSPDAVVPKSHAILINNGSNGNTFYSNKIVSSNKEGLEIDQDATSKNNIFSNNQIPNLGASTINNQKSTSQQARK
jgi:hypothetical protein